MHDHTNHQEINESSFWAYVPLFLVLAGIVLGAYLIQLFAGIFSVEHSLRLFMALFFLTFGSFKLLAWKDFVDAYQGYDVLAKRSRFYAWLYPLIELTLGLLFLTNTLPIFSNAFAVLIMGISSIGVIKTVLAHHKIQCACLGTVIKLPMSTITIIEDVGMGLMALGMLLYLLL